MIGRGLVLVAAFASTGILVHSIRRIEAPVTRAPLASVPMDLSAWTGRAAQPLDSRVIAALGSDDYIDRLYAAPRDIPISLFVGYYASQRQGDTMHSPLNCLPGDGWTPVSHGTVDLGSAARPVHVNRYVIEKGADRQLVLYWYEGRGRFIANEYAAKAYLVLDAIRRGRTDGALVRVVTPIAGIGADAEQRAEARAVSFAVALLPALTRALPS